jgi:hypothetical protein
MTPNRILEHIDNKIVSNLDLNYSFVDIINHLESLSNKFKERDSFLPCDELFLLENWKNIPIKERYTTYYVISCLKRISDINWILSKNIDIENKKMYKLIILKSKFNDNL